VSFVLPMHLQWAVCGAEHFTSPPLPSESASSDERFTAAYNSASRLGHEAGPDLNRCNFLRKRRAGRQPTQIVCPSD
jgi:hypothetical protein